VWREAESAQLQPAPESVFHGLDLPQIALADLAAHGASRNADDLVEIF
jgi:hypothetical protein